MFSCCVSFSSIFSESHSSTIIGLPWYLFQTFSYDSFKQWCMKYFFQTDVNVYSKTSKDAFANECCWLSMSSPVLLKCLVINPSMWIINILQWFDNTVCFNFRILIVFKSVREGRRKNCVDRVQHMPTNYRHQRICIHFFCSYKRKHTKIKLHKAKSWRKTLNLVVPQRKKYM